jgi:uncharacterized delta-60 repeat protein
MKTSRITINCGQSSTYFAQPPFGQRTSSMPWARISIAFAFVALMALAVVSYRVAADGGALDSSFSGGGKIATDFTGASEDEAYALAIQPDGRIVVSGTTSPDNEPNHYRAALARYNPDGTLDQSFGISGKVIATAPGLTQGFAVALQPDGKILTSGFGSGNVMRFNNDGSLDNSFGSSGVNGFLVYPYAMILQPDGKILVGGYLSVSYGRTDFALGRFNGDGTVDNSFGSGGKVTTDITGGHAEIHALALQPDGKIVAVGRADCCGNHYYAALARYNSNGTLDTGFGVNGKVFTQFNSGSNYYSSLAGVAIQPDAKLLVVGSHIARFNSDGTLDSSFGSGGHIEAGASAIALQPDGRFLVGFGSSNSFALAHYNQDGSIDKSFGFIHRGMVITQIYGNNDGISALALQPDGKVVAAGSGSRIASGNGFYADSDFALARYSVSGPAPIPPPSFLCGKVTESDYATAVSGVTVTLSNYAGKKTTQTDANGNYRFDNLTYGANYTVTAYRPGYDSDPPRYNLDNLDWSAAANFTSIASSESIWSAIGGQVWDSQGNNINGVTMTLTGDGGFGTKTLVTGSGYLHEGEYNFYILTRGRNYTVTPSKPGYSFTPATQNFANLTADQEANFIGTTAPTAAPAVISGSITARNGTPLSGVVMYLSGSQSRKTITDADGHYHFDNVEANGFYTVTPSRVNYSFNPFNRSFSVAGNKTDAVFAATSMGDNANPLDTPEYFVRQQYVDVLGREPDEAGFNYWSDQILACGDDVQCLNGRRRDVAAAFFIEREFQASGSFIYDLYAGALGRRPLFAEYSADRQQVVGGATLEAEKSLFAQSFVQRAEFMAKYQNALTPESFVDAVIQGVRSSGADLSGERANLINSYNSGGGMVAGRAAVLRAIGDNAAFKQSQYNAAFVLTEYFGYLRRDPDQGGFDFWLNVLNNREPGNFRGMVCSFITSTEYQRRFSAIVSRSNAECGQ